MQSHYTGGGPLWTVSLYFDSGSVPRYSYMFLGGSIVAFAIFLPLLDRAETQAQGVPDRRRRTGLVRPRLSEESATAMIATWRLPLLEQGSVQFILMGIMILAIFAALWVTISK